MAISDHSELIAVLTELYTLLNTLAAAPANSLISPQSDTGKHTDFNSDAAREAGFSDEAVEVRARARSHFAATGIHLLMTLPSQAMSAIPYMESGIPIEPSTCLLSYTGRHMDCSAFQERREIRFDPDDLAPPSAIALTESRGAGTGRVYLYDATKSMSDVVT